MAMRANKRKTEDLIREAQNVLGRRVAVVKLEKSNHYALYIESTGPSSVHGGMDLITTSEDINEIKIYLMGIEVGAAYKY